MIAVGHTLVSDDIAEKKFVCNLARCKGECCVAGDMGAPLDNDEATKIQDDYERIRPYMRPEGIDAVSRQGFFIVDPVDGELTTPLVDDKECAFVVFDAAGIASCAIEKAWQDGQTDFQKPVSCHLYPIRIQPYDGFDALNYHEWDVCAPACSLGKELSVPVYRFLKDALTRKYGQAWYDELAETITALEETRKAGKRR
jgi:hypothetical protein